MYIFINQKHIHCFFFCFVFLKFSFIYLFIFSFLGEDISKPLKNSFIHTGHGDVGGSTWGDPGFIDE